MLTTIKLNNTRVPFGKANSQATPQHNITKQHSVTTGQIVVGVVVVTVEADA